MGDLKLNDLAVPGLPGPGLLLSFLYLGLLACDGSGVPADAGAAITPDADTLGVGDGNASTTADAPPLFESTGSQGQEQSANTDPPCAGNCGPGASSNEAPVILSLATNVSSIGPGQTVVFTAVVTDPNGIDDLIGGSLVHATGSSYGAFMTSAAEGSYSLSLTWNDISAVEPFNFVGSEQRKLTAVFYDVKGAKKEKELYLTLACGNAKSGGCGNQCVDLMSDKNNCGACGNNLYQTSYQDPSDMMCIGGSFVCHSYAQALCGGLTCIELDSDVAHCGSCGVDCQDYAAQGTVACSSGICTIGGVNSTVPQSCDEICTASGFAQCVFLQTNIYMVEGGTATEDHDFGSSCHTTPPASYNGLFGKTWVFQSMTCKCKEPALFY